VAFDLVIRNGTLVTSAGRRVADLALSDGRIAAGDPAVASDDARQTIDATGLVVLPGVVDAHVHFREPGLEHEETWLTGTRSAVMGGVTTVLEMPNTVPPTDTLERARAKLADAADSAYCDFGIFALVGESIDLLEDVAGSGLVVGLKVFMGPTTGDLRAPDDAGLRRALEIARDANLRVAFHAEDRSIVEQSEVAVRATSRIDAAAHLDARPFSAEVAAVDRVGRVLHETHARGHILHLSSAAGLAAVEYWRAEDVDLTCEVTPHHLFLDRDVYGTAGGLARVNPPIRGGDDAAALRAAVADGRIDYIATDHAPHLAADKQQASIWDVPSGFAGVETLVPLLLTHGVNAGWLSLERLAQVTSEAPRRVWGLPDGDVNLTIVDVDREGSIRAAALHGKNNLSPFEGMTTRGQAVATIVRGVLVMRDGEMIPSIKPGFGRAISR
jgi:dihydroorotase